MRITYLVCSNMNNIDIQNIVASKDAIIKELDTALLPYRPLADIRDCLAASSENNKYEMLGVIVSAQAVLNEFKAAQKALIPVQEVKAVTYPASSGIVRRLIRTRKNALDTEEEVMRVVKSAPNGITIREISEKIGIGTAYATSILRSLSLEGKLDRYEKAHDTGRPVYVYRNVDEVTQPTQA